MTLVPSASIAARKAPRSTAQALEEPTPNEFPASGRTDRPADRLADLRLRNERVFVKYKSNPTKHVHGTLCGDEIRLINAGHFNHVPLTPKTFVAIAEHQVHSEKEACELIYLQRGPSLQQTLQSGKRPGWNAAAITAFLRDQYAVTTMQDLPRLFMEQADLSAQEGQGKYAYRVCRSEETAEKIVAGGLQIAGASYRSQHPTGLVGGYFGSMCEHIKRGSHERRRPFISATRDLSSAMHWSYAGVSTIVKIDLDACREQGTFYWDCCRDSFLLYGPMAAIFVEASKEIVLDDNISASCCSVIKVNWEFSADIQRTEQTPASRKLFPAWQAAKHLKLDPQEAIDVVEVLETGSTKPLKVQIDGHTFVMKRGVSDGLPNPSHMSSEFFSLALYNAMGAAVPRAALCHVKVTADDDDLRPFSLHTKFLLTEFLHGATFAYGASVANDRVWVKQLVSVQEKCAADIAMSNYDVAGPGYNNLLVSNDQVCRVDVGGSLSFQPDGKLKSGDHWRSTTASVVTTANSFSYRDKVNQNNFSKLAAAQSKNTATAHQAVLEIFGDVAKDPFKLAAQARHILLTFAAYMNSWFDQNKRNQDAQWITDFHIVLRRLEILRAAMPVPEPAAFSGGDIRRRNSKRPAEQADAESGRRVHHHHGAPNSSSDSGAGEGSSGSADASPSHWGLRNIVVVNSRSAKKLGGWTIKFQEQYVDKNYEVIDITSKGNVRWQMLSPFFPHGGIAIPGAAPGCVAKSVEGIWQGLKVFPDGTGIDQRKFSNGTMQNLKRSPWTKAEGRKHKLQPMGHWWGNFEGVDTTVAPQGGNARLLNYVEAREQIYVPAYMSVIERPATHEKLVELAHRAMHKDLVLLDYFTNDDVTDTSTPLSHAGLVRKYLMEHEEELLSAVPQES